MIFAQFVRGTVFLGLTITLPGLAGCGEVLLNNPYPEEDRGKNILYSSFEERPKHLDPARSYSADEYRIIGQVYEPPLQYQYLQRPYALEPLTAAAMPAIRYLDQALRVLPEDAREEDVAYSEYEIRLREGIRYQPHPAFARTPEGGYRYHALQAADLADVSTLADFPDTGTRELTAEDYLYEIKRLVHPRIHSPIAELMKEHIVGLKDLAERLDAEYRNVGGAGFLDLRKYALAGVEIIDRYRYRIRLHGKYPQFRYWLAMSFFGPMPWEADRFYSQPGMAEKNLTLDWYPVGTGPYWLAENNPNRRMVLVRNPNYHEDHYPSEGEPGDAAAGLLADAGRRIPFVDRLVMVLEKENIPYWNKFLQGYYDASGIVSDNFDQAVQFSGQGSAELTPEMKERRIHLAQSVATSTFYLGFNMLDPVIGGYDEKRAKLRQAISIALDYEEFIAIFTNGRGVPAQGVLPPGIYGYEGGEAGINRYVYDWINGAARRKSVAAAKRLLAEAGYPAGIDAKTGSPLVLYFDTVARGPDDKALLSWYRKQFGKIGIQLVLRTTDYNQFQQKMATGAAQIYQWGWNADYPDPENFFFLLYGPNRKVGKGGENASNYQNPEFDRLFERMRNMDDDAERFRLIQKMQDIARRDAPWIFGMHPKNFSLHHDWYRNLKPNLMANNELKYQRILPEGRERMRRLWNRPVLWPLGLGAVALLAAILPAWLAYRRRMRAAAL